MKALLLIGGLATRLRPLSITRPKCLFPIQNKPIIDYLLENLAEAGCDEVILAVNNHAEKIQEYLGEEKYGVSLIYNLEDTSLGTGGPVKLAEKHLKDEPFLVLNGDILSFIDYHELMENHVESGAAATLTLTRVEDPSRYGVARLENNTIKEFIEKPTREQAPSNWINAGCYALNPEILDTIPSGRKVSIERETFPKYASNSKLNAYKYYEDWIDIGVPRDYLRANKLLQTSKHASSISPESIIGEGSKIQDSIIWENTVIGSNTVITDSIIGANCRIGDNVKINNAVIADNVKIEDLIIIPEGTKIWPNQTIQTSITRPSQEIK